MLQTKRYIKSSFTLEDVLADVLAIQNPQN